MDVDGHGHRRGARRRIRAARPNALTTAERAASDRTWTYGHIVVDEAQELSPMQWRLLLRRNPLRSLHHRR